MNEVLILYLSTLGNDFTNKNLDYFINGRPKLEHIIDKPTCNKMIDVRNMSRQSETVPDAVLVNRRIFDDISLTNAHLTLFKARFDPVTD